jgi:uncharacterized membrane protein
MILLDFSFFFGRFHPLVIHLPIGFIIIALIFEVAYAKSRANLYLKPGILLIQRITWFLSFISSGFAAFLGWMLAQNGHYIESQLFFHQWSGILLVFLSGLGWVLRIGHYNFSRVLIKSNNFLIFILLVLVGHYGSILTHGESYLIDYAPEPIKKFINPHVKNNYSEVSIDSIIVFKDLISPIFNSKCVACHNDDVSRAGLNMTSLENIFKGGASGNPLQSKDLNKSILFKRITLAQSDLKFMPPSGEPLTYDEINLIRWWITNGLKDKVNLSSEILSDNEKSLLSRIYKIESRTKPWYEKLTNLPEIDSIELKRLEQNDFSWKLIAEKYQLVNVKYNGSEITDEKLLVLLKLKNHIISLDISDANLKDTQLDIISKFDNIMFLNIQKNPISDLGAVKLQSLQHIEKLNLYGTNISNSSLSIFSKITSLKKIYLWKTEVTQEELEDFNTENPTKEGFLGIEK